MSDAVIALVSAMMTTIGLAMVNKLMSRPSEHWKQASEMREELRKDLSRAQDEVELLRRTEVTRDEQFLDMREQIFEMKIELKRVSVELADCHSKHQQADANLERVRTEFKTQLKSKGSV